VHIVIMGCGRVGSELAVELEREGHSLAVVDRSAESFRRLGPTFSGQTVTGIGFDRDTLRAAGIERAHAFAAVSSGDNSNILAARVARETFNVDRVVARIYDPKRAEIYERLGIPTVATVAWSTGQMLRRLLPQGISEEWRDPSGQVILSQVHFSSSWIGKDLPYVEAATGVRVGFLSRFGTGILPRPGVVLQEGDILHLIMDADDEVRIEELLAGEPRQEER